MRRAYLNFAIVGGGPTGVELAGALAEIARHSLTQDFRHINPADAHIMLVEAGPRVLGAYAEDLSAKALAALNRLGVTVRSGTMVTDITPIDVELKIVDGRRALADADRAVGGGRAGLAAGARRCPAPPACTMDRAGRLAVEADCSLPGRPNVFVLGDMASYTGDDGKPLPGVAPVAIQQGKFVAKLIRAAARRQVRCRRSITTTSAAWRRSAAARQSPSSAS